MLLVLLLLLLSVSAQVWCKENRVSEDLSSLADAPKAGRFLKAWCSGKWVSVCGCMCSTVGASTDMQGTAGNWLQQPEFVQWPEHVLMCLYVEGG